MSFIGKNIKKIRAVKKVSQISFSELFKLSRTSVGSYEEGRAEPKIDTIIQIANHFGIAIDLLLTKELTINDLYHFDVFKVEKDSRLPPVINNPVNLLPVISLDSRLEYIVKYKDKKYIATLPTITSPFKVNLNFKAFEHQGSEMEYQNIGIHHGDTLIASPVDKSTEGIFKKNEIYLIVLEDKITVKRLIDTQEDFLTFSLDNPHYQDEKINTEKIKELYQVLGVFTTKLYNPTLFKDRISILEDQVQYLMKKIE